MNHGVHNVARSVTACALALSLSACGNDLSNTDIKSNAHTVQTSSEGSAGGILKTVQPLVGTMWSQPGVVGSFTISERSISGSDGCNLFHPLPDEYFIFAPDGTIVQNAHFARTRMSCGGRKELSSGPWDGWKTYELRDGQLIIKTATGAIHTFTPPDPAKSIHALLIRPMVRTCNLKSSRKSVT